MRNLFAIPRRSTEASAQQIAATGAAGGALGVDPVDQERNWRLAGSAGREVPWWTTEKARINAINAYRANPMATAIIDTYCVDDETEILTADGWRHYDQVEPGIEVLTLNHETGMSEWQPVQSMHVFPAKSRDLVRLRTRDHSSLTTGNHRWPVVSRRREWRDKGWDGYRETRSWRTSDALTESDWIIRAAQPADAPTDVKWSDDFVELVAWTYTEGHVRDSGAVILTQSASANPDYVERIDAVLRRLYGPPAGSMRRGTSRYVEPRWLRVQYSGSENVRFKLSKEAADPVVAVAPDKVPALAWLRELTQAQLRLFIDVSLMADGDSPGLWPEGQKRGCHLGQKDLRRSEAFQYALILAGLASSMVERTNDGHHVVSAHKRSRSNVMRAASVAERADSDSAVCETVRHDGIVWCPHTENQTWLARREGTVYFTGNTSFCVGDSGVGYQVSNPQVLQVVDEFWTDPRNNLADNQELLFRSHLIMGESLYELMAGPQTGVVRYSPIDPGRITGVDLLHGNPLWPSKVLLNDWRDDGGLTVAAVNDDTGLREGNAAFWPSFKALDTDVRGTPFLMSVLDQLDSFDTVLSNLIDRTALARYMVWDVTVQGGQAQVDEFVAARGGTHVPPSGSVEVHNESVTWEPKYAQSGAVEDSVAARQVLTQVAAGSGLARTWLADPEDSNRATSLTMAEPVRRRVGGVQKMWLGRMAEFTRFAIDRAVAAGRLPRTVEATDQRTGRSFQVPASRAVTITGPEVAAADAQLQAQVLLNLSTGLEKLVQIGALTRDGARIAARKAWEDYVGIPYTVDLDSPDANVDDLATAVDTAMAEALRRR